MIEKERKFDLNREGLRLKIEIDLQSEYGFLYLPGIFKKICTKIVIFGMAIFRKLLNYIQSEIHKKDIQNEFPELYELFVKLRELMLDIFFVNSTQKLQLTHENDNFEISRN